MNGRIRSIGGFYQSYRKYKSNHCGENSYSKCFRELQGLQRDSRKDLLRKILI